MTAAELRSKGVARYGMTWVTKLAAEMGVVETTVRRWAKDDVPISERAERHINLIFAQKV